MPNRTAQGALEILDPQNRWVKLSGMIPWDLIEEKYSLTSPRAVDLLRIKREHWAIENKSYKCGMKSKRKLCGLGVLSAMRVLGIIDALS